MHIALGVGITRKKKRRLPSDPLTLGPWVRALHARPRWSLCTPASQPHQARAGSAKVYGPLDLPERASLQGFRVLPMGTARDPFLPDSLHLSRRHII